jgi:hypothetical protein
VAQEDDLATIANRIWRPLDLVLGYLGDSLRDEYDRCAIKGIDPEEDPCTFAANVRKDVYDEMKPHLPQRPSRAPMSPLHLDLGPYQLKVLHADNGTVPRARTKARKAFYRRNELGIVSMNLVLDHPLIELAEEITLVEDGSLVLVWDNLGPDLTRADLYRPPLTNFPGKHLDLLTNTVIEVEPDIDVRLDNADSWNTQAATGTDDATSTHHAADASVDDEDRPAGDEPAKAGTDDPGVR